MRSFFLYALWTDLRRRSSWALLLSMVVIATSVALCSVLFSVARAVREAVEAEIIKSGAANAMEVAARPDQEYRKPWAAPPIGTDDPAEALQRLEDLLREELGEGVITEVVPSWISPGWVYIYLTPPGRGGVPVSVGVSLTSPSDPEGVRVEQERLDGGWVDSVDAPQVVLPKKISDRLWQDVMFTGETAWLGITETSTCVEVEVKGIYARTQRNYAFANAPVAGAIQHALEEARNDHGEELAQRPGDAEGSGMEEGDSPPVATTGSQTTPKKELRASASSREKTDLSYDRIRIYFDGRRSLLKARALVEERYKFWATTPYDRFESRLRLAAAARVSAWTVFGITLGSACGAIFCTFLAWVSRRRYEIALFKAQGSGNAWVAGTYMVQSGAAGLVAGLIGVLFGGWLCPVLADRVTRSLDLKSDLVLALPWPIAAALVFAAFAVAVTAAALPARIAARQDPWEILREAA